MREPGTVSWGLTISDSDFEKLKAGFEPRDMDDKWRFSAADDSPDGMVAIHVSRYLVRTELYVLVIDPSDGNSSKNGAVKIKAIRWEQNKNGIRITADMAKKEVVVLCRCILGCDIDALPKYGRDEVFHYPTVQPGAS